ncbi:MAG: cell division protein FtsH, partial [candidate division Zixibacteria bacterium]|nr:cell division protein FtsH [candidate division Zixibacteria bacterium]
RKMVCNWGMSDKLGPVTFGRTEEHVFLGRELGRQQDYSESTAVIIDQEIRRFIEQAEHTAESILKEHLEKLHKLAKALLEKEIIDSNEVDQIVGTVPGDTAPVEAPEPAPSK